MSSHHLSLYFYLSLGYKSVPLTSLFSFSGHSSLFPMEDSFPDDERGDQGLAGLGSPHCFPHQNGERVERYSRKVFVGGLPPDIDEGTVVALKSQELIFVANIS